MTAAHGTDTDSRSRRVFAVLGTAVFLVLVPGTVAGLVPWWISRWRVHAPFFGFTALRGMGALLIAAGIAVLLESFVRFAFQGIGTPAPVFPPRHLVVTGFYRYVRNPMYVAAISLLLGQALVFGNIRLFAYVLFGWLVTHLFVVFYEEPTLRRTFGAEYAVFCAHVPRWIPRLHPWHEGS
jgi:protein-S-isoprenylcysteine O-methyltransferase Ste14